MTGTMNIDLATGWTNGATMNMDASGKQGDTLIDMKMTMKLTSK